MNSANGTYQGGPQPSTNGSFFAQRGAVPATHPPPPRPFPQQNAGSVTNTFKEKFEDEKARIIASCFSKRDPQGRVTQTYLAHFRVEEDGMHQSSPPPPDASRQHKKSRMIMLAATAAGKPEDARIFMYKARENDDGSFQIGKTWSVDELQAIQVYSPQTARTPEEQQQAAWAGLGGVTITMAKPYYWKAQTPQEKAFFIGTLVRTFRRYTKGRLPALIGFTKQEVDALTAGPTYEVDGQRPPSHHYQPPAPISLSQPQTNQRPISPASSMHSSIHSSSIGMASNDPTPLRATQQQRPVQISQPPTIRQIDPRTSDPRSFQRTPSPTAQARVAPLPQPSQQQAPRSFAPVFPPAAPHLNVDFAERRSNDASAAFPNYLQPLVTNNAASAQNNTFSPLSPGQVSPGTHPVSTDTASRWRPGGLVTTATRSVADSLGDEQSPGTRAPSVQPWKTSGLTTTATRSIANSLADEQSPGTTAPSAQPWRTASPAAGSVADSLGDEHSPGTTAATSQRWRPDSVGTTPRSAVDSTGDEHSPGSTPAPRLNGNIIPGQLIPERRRPPMQDPAPSDNLKIRKQSVVTEPSPLATRPPMQYDDYRENIHDETLPEVRPLRPSGTPQKQKPSPTIVVQTEQDNAPSPTRSTQSAQSPANSNSGDTLQRATSPEERQHRPGLGPMMKSSGSGSEILANKFRKAATAYGAFKPRAGGAGERLLGAKAANPNEPDGVTRVVPAPLSRSAIQDVAPQAMPTRPNEVDKGFRPLSLRTDRPMSPSLDGPASPNSPTGPAQAPVPIVEVTDEQAMARRPSKIVIPKPARKQTDFFAKSLANMEIDPSIVNNQHTEFENVLTDFNWDTNLLQTKQIDILKINLKRDIARLEAGSWLGDSEHKDDRVAMVEHLLDRAIAECDEVEGLLTLYSVELSTLNEDVAYIEAQSQGLQVQTANQKLLHTELQKLIATTSLDASQLEPLRKAPLGDPQGLDAIEQSLLLLYKALQTIDPALLGKEVAAGHARKDEQALSSMRALQEKRSLYLNEAQQFLVRIRNYAEPTFAMAFQKAKESSRRNSSSSRASQHDLSAHDSARSSLWQLRPLMIFAEEVDKRAWQDILATYVVQARTTYSGEVQDMISQWKKGTRRPSGEEQDALFTAQEKEADGLAGTARKLTVKRSQTLARMTRAASAEKRAAINRNQENKQPFEAFAGALEDTVPLVYTEQNFIIDFFHSKSLENIDFAEAVMASRPSERRGTNLHLPRRHVDGERAMSKELLGLMEGVFPTWANELQALMDWALQADPFQGIGILCALERKRTEVEDSNQEFIIRSINRSFERLSISFQQFVDGQIRAIEETKVKINKRKGVIAFIKVFPNFSIIVENMLPPADGPERLETRSMVDDAYDRIVRSMFDSLKTIAKATPQAGPGFGADPEDKEALNYHILLIENMFHFYNELEERGDPALGQWRGKAMIEMSEHQELYVNAIIRRPLGKLLDFLDGAENLIGRGATPSSIPASHPSHSRSVYKKILATYDSREIRRGIDTLRKRIEKHFAEADDATISAELIKKITAECERKYNDAQKRATRIAGEMYKGSVQVEFTKQDVGQAFRR